MSTAPADPSGPRDAREPRQTTAGTASRQAIQRAAERLFNLHGYAGTSVRAVAAEAGQDPAMVIRYFGSKEQLFLDAVDVQGHFESVMSGPLEGLGRRLVATILDGGREIRFGSYRAMMRASDSSLVRDRLVETMESMFIAPLVPRMSGPDAALRARLVAAQVSGLLDGVAILGDARVTEADEDRLVALYGDAIQTLIGE